MAGSRELKLVIVGDASSAQRALGGLSGTVDQTQSRFGKFAQGMKPIMAAAGAAVAIQFGKASIDAFGESQKVAGQTAAVLKSTGNTAGTSAAGVAKLAGDLQKLSGVEDETIQAGQNMLLTFTNIRNGTGKTDKVFDDATKTLLDMSVAMGTEPKQAAIQLGKALNDPVKGISALSRVGVTFTDQQKDQIKALVASGDTMGAQKVILAELNKEFGGSAKAAGDALTPNQKLGIAMGELQEKVGGALVPAMSKLADTGIAVVEFISNLSPGVQKAIGVVAGLAVAAFTIVKAVQMWTTVQAALNVVMSANPIVLIGLAIAGLVVALVLAYQKSETFRDIVQAVFRAVATAAGVAKDFIVGAFDVLKGAATSLGEILGAAFGLVGKAAIAMKDVALGAIRALVDFWLAQVEWIIKGAQVAFGWIPWIKDPINAAAKAVEKFRDDVNASLGGIQDKTITIRFMADKKAIERAALGDIAKWLPGYDRHDRPQHRARGGPVWAGEGYVVGEEGPEFFQPDANGVIIPNGRGRAVGAAAAGSGAPVVYITNNFSGIMAGRGGLRAIAEELAEEMSAALARRGMRNGAVLTGVI